MKTGIAKRGTLIALLAAAATLGGVTGTAYSQEAGMPDWIRQLFLFWTDEQVDDTDLVNAIGFLIDEGVIKTTQSDKIESLEREIAQLRQENKDLMAENDALRDAAAPQDAGEERMHGSISTQTASPILGNPDAKVTIVEFGDYQCPKCKTWFDNTKPSIHENYIKTGQVNMVFVDFPFIGPTSKGAAEASYCAEDQGMYWEYHDKLYSSQGWASRNSEGWASADNLKGFAADLGLDQAAFTDCLDSGKYRDRVQNNRDVAAVSDISATPSFVIVSSDGQEERINGAQPYPTFRAILDSLL